MFINYDEWGGFFDHVSPRFVPDDLASPNLNESFGITGFRIPGIALSPYARRGYVSHATVTHESILKLIAYRFGLGYLNKRHRYASNIGYTFDWANPRFDPPVLPAVLPPATISCTAQGAPPPPTAETGFGSPEWADYLAKLGYQAQPARADTVFSSSGAHSGVLADLWRSK
jgi:phospholipase C